MDIQRTDLKKKLRRRKLLIALVSLSVVVLLGGWVAQLDPAAPGVERSTLWTDSVQRGEMLREVRGPGILVPREIRWIAAETSARVERIAVRPGAMVDPDTVIIELSNPDLVEQVFAARSALTAAQADYSARQMSLESQLLDQRANLSGIRADHESAALQAVAERELADKGIIASIQARRSALTAEQLALRIDIEIERISKFEQTLAAQLAADRARMDQLANALELRQRQVDALQVRAGFAGILQQVPVQEGEQLAPGTNLARVARPGDLMAELRIAETQAKDVALHQPVRVDTRNGIVPGRVTRIDPAVHNGTVLVDVELDGELPPGARPDLSVDGTIEIERLDDVLFVGRPAYAQPNSQVRLFRIDGEGHSALRVPVKLGRASVGLIEIVEGLQPGDRIVLSDTSQWDAHDRLRLR